MARLNTCTNLLGLFIGKIRLKHLNNTINIISSSKYSLQLPNDKAVFT